MSSASSSSWTCHWAYVHGPRGQAPTLVWICEYPYRTMRSGPNEDCAGCRRAMELAARHDVTSIGAEVQHAH